MGVTARTAGAFIALVAWFGLAVQFSATHAASGSVGETIWILARYFTILTNLLVAIVMTRVALGRRVSPFALGGATLAILLVGIVYLTMLRALHQLEGAALLADRLLHYTVPALAGLFWLALASKDGLRWRDPFLWSLYPLVYLGYVLIRGGLDALYPYPFIDVAAIGLPLAVLNSFGIWIGFVAFGLVLVWLGRRLLGPRPRMSKAPQ